MTGRMHSATYWRVRAAVDAGLIGRRALRGAIRAEQRYEAEKRSPRSRRMHSAYRWRARR